MKATQKELCRIQSQILRSERIKLKMTLEEVSSGICSISYLSKLENNYVEPGSVYIQRICERMKLDYELVSEHPNVQALEIAVNSYLYADVETVDNLKSKLDYTLTYARNLLVDVVYCFLHKELDGVDQLLQRVRDINNTLDNYEKDSMHFLMAETFIKRKNYVRAKDILLCNVQLVTDKTLKLLYFEAILLSAFHLNILELYYLYYEKINTLIDLSYPVKKKVVLDLMKDCISSQYNLDALTEINNNYIRSKRQDSYRIEVEYYYALILIKNNRYDEAIGYIEKTAYVKTPRFSALYALCHLKLERTIKIEEQFIDCIKEEEHKRFLQFIINYGAAKKPLDDLSEFKINYIDKMASCQHHLYDKVYSEYYVSSLESQSKYKEAERILKLIKL
jgi:transcriptional regulator with XRE-family HTH domain